jgi:hypothetical protein
MLQSRNSYTYECTRLLKFNFTNSSSPISNGVFSSTIQIIIQCNEAKELYKAGSSLRLYFHTVEIRLVPLALTKCSYSKKTEAGKLI